MVIQNTVWQEKMVPILAYLSKMKYLPEIQKNVATIVKKINNKEKSEVFTSLLQAGFQIPIENLHNFSENQLITIAESTSIFACKGRFQDVTCQITMKESNFKTLLRIVFVDFSEKIFCNLMPMLKTLPKSKYVQHFMVYSIVLAVEKHVEDENLLSIIRSDLEIRPDGENLTRVWILEVLLYLSPFFNLWHWLDTRLGVNKILLRIIGWDEQVPKK